MIRRAPQRLVCALLATAPPAASAQHAAAAQLWQVAGATLPLPPALADGGAATFWNPAQTLDTCRAFGAIEFVQAPTEIGVAGLLATVHLRVSPVGHVGLVYGRMQVTDLVRTTVSPEPVPGGVPYYTHAAGLAWTRAVGGMTVGALVALHATRLDDLRAQRVTVDLGVTQRLGSRLRLAAATHRFSPGSPSGAGEAYGGVGYQLWRGELWDGSRQGALEARYGITFARSVGTDHLAGLGLAVGDGFEVDLLLAREGGYDEAAWRPVGGLRVGVGRYQVGVSRDAGVRGLGSSFRVELAARTHD